MPSFEETNLTPEQVPPPVNITANPNRKKGEGYIQDRLRYARTGMWDMRGFKPFAWQREALAGVAMPPSKDDPQFIALNIGRQAGKTTVLAELCWEGLVADWSDVDDLGPCAVRLFADTYEHGMMIYDVVWNEAATVLAPLIHRLDGERKIITLKSEENPEQPGATLQLLSGENPKSLTGHNKLTLGISDESQFVKDEAWKQYRPTLGIRKARHVAAGVCQGTGWYREMSRRGLKEDDFENYLTLRFSSLANPYIDMDMYEAAKGDYTPEEFAELYDAVWQKQGGVVFENVQNCIVAREMIFRLKNGEPIIFEEPDGVSEYVAGLDIAQKNDFMALLIAKKSTGRIVAAFRCNKRTYTFAEAQVSGLLLKYTPRVFGDVTGMGMASWEHIRREVLGAYDTMDNPPPTRPRFVDVELQTSERKRIIDELALALIAERIRFPNITQLVDELQDFEKKVTPAGNVRMEAPDGLHDDLVFSLALLNQGVPRPPRRSVNGAGGRRRGGWELL